MNAEHTLEHDAVDLALENFVASPNLPPYGEFVKLAKRFLRVHGEPNDMLHHLLAVQSLKNLWEEAHQ